jgi:hypothetical protein
MAHDSLIKQVSERRQAHGRTRVAVTHLLNGIGGEQTSRVDGSGVEVRPPLRMSDDDVRLLAAILCRG